MDPYKSPWGDIDETVGARGKDPGKRISPGRFSRQTKIIFGLVGVFVLLAVGVIYYLYFSASEIPALSVAITKPDKIYVGAPFTISVSLTNTSNKILNSVTASLALPDQLSFVGNSVGKRSLEEAAGDMGPGELKSQSFSVIASGGSQSVAHVSAAANYGTSGNSARFESRGATDAFIGSSAVDLALSIPQSVFNGKDFDFTVNYKNNTDQDFKGFAITLAYPNEFQFKTSNVNPTNNAKNQWSLGTLTSGENGSIAVTGNITDTEGSFYPVNATATAQIAGVPYALGMQTGNIAISYSPLSVSVALTGHDNPVVAPGDALNYALTYKNNSATTFQDVTITANLIGALYDYSSLRSSATFDSVNHILRWFAANTPSLGSVAPGESGMITFSVSLLANYPIKIAQDKNFKLTINAQINSQTVPTGTEAPGTAASSSIQNKVQGKITLASKGYWRDARSGIVNTGPYPPRVNKPTQYTVHWILKDYAADMVNIRVSAALQSGTRFTGIVRSNATKKPLYDPASGIVTWNISYLAANKGVLNAPPEAIFQIENVPAVNQVGFQAPLLGNIQVQAQDSFTGATLISVTPDLTSALPDDTTLSNISNRTVRP